MKRRRLKELNAADQAVKMNLTPMIDCTFLLLTFFMIVSELSQLNMEALSLPHASEASSDSASEDVLTINIREKEARKGIVRIMGRPYDRDKLAEIIRKEAIKSGREHDPEHPGVEIHKLNVLVRCDRDAKYEAVQSIFDACSKSGVYKTALAASPSTE